MKRQGGFTLIELVVVIVILGILAVTAAPKFLNLQSDARASSLQGLKGAMAGAAGIVYGKAAIEGVERSENAVEVDGIQAIHGYPTAAANGIGAAVVGLADDAEWEVVSAAVTVPPTISYKFANNGSDTCIVTYKEATSVAAPVITAADAEKC
ncbi:type II secretion system protein [Aliivibrio finisterrensis]|uniref:Type II secretion system protein n=1 Tax=Aliivibrio finisterrensis TaxID=511998 RepID=A0A6N6RRH9_9GAMM|nr:prepilin-type N-terminal cleavage/methylation domain-containing protein [Aliivibrio finisterrensis]KAB2824170.1 type II secretion system protein [Aliivibrio finisterrensis]